DVLFGKAVDVIGILDRELLLRYVNWTAAGLEREAITGRSVFELVPPGYVDSARDAYTSVLRTGNGVQFETMCRKGDIVDLWEVRAGPIHFEGEVIGLVVITTDVTEQRRAHADRDRFFALSLDMLVVATRDGRFKRVNPAFGATLGYAVSDLIGTRFIDL